jgi:glycine cleavage system aminomethyltransferase T
VRTQSLQPNVRRSPYFAGTERAGATAYMVYNHMYMAMAFDRDPMDDYRAVTERVALWDVGAERQVQVAGPDAVRFADYLVTRDLANVQPGDCRYALCCDERGEIICDSVVVVPRAHVVWLSHGTIDLLLWVRGIALHAGYDVEVSEPDIAPLQVQGPRSREVLRKLVGSAIDGLRYYRCMPAEIAGLPVVVSRTGWSGELGYEIFPLSEDRAMELFDTVLEAGREFDMLVTGPNLPKALEAGISDTAYYTNAGLNALELGRDSMVDLDAGPFVGREALLAIRRAGVRRRVVGLLGPPGARLPRLETFWPIRNGSAQSGATRWQAFSPALSRAVAIGVVRIEDATPGQTMTVSHPLGDTEMTVAELPFVDSSTRARA